MAENWVHSVRILIANYRYFVSSGPERYLFNVTDRLEALGHTVMPFSISYAQNRASEYDRYFVSPLGGADEVFFDQHKKSIATAAKTMSRLFYSREVEQAIGRMIDEQKPDVAYILYYLRKLSPSLLVAIKKRSIPIVARISDYGMMCGEHHMLRNEKPCTLCLDKGLWESVRHRCIKNSLPVSLIEAVATTYHRARGYFDLIDQFVTTNDFMSEMMVRAGVAPDRITCIPTFTDFSRFTPGPGAAVPPYFLYVGRLDRPKGVHLLIEAMALLRERYGASLPPLKLAGEGHMAAYVEELKARVATAGLEQSVEFLGAIPADDVPAWMRGATSLLMPALWYENLPNSVVESFASACPVIAANIGSLASTVTDGVDGLHHEPGSAADIALQMTRMIDDPALRDRLAAGARRTAELKHSPDGHIRQLLGLLGEVTAGRSVERRSAADALPAI